MIDIPKLPKPEGGDKAPRWFHVAVALSMVLSAGAALVSALRTSETMKGLVEQNAKQVEQHARMVKASSTPILQYGTSNLNDRDEPEIRLEVENVGTGPARVVWFEAKLDGKPLKAAWELITIARDRVSPGWKPNNNMTSTIASVVMPPNHTVYLLRFPVPNRKDTEGLKVFEAVDTLRHQLQVSACYCSVFEECWLVEFGRHLPQSVERCEPQGHVSVNGG